jgi:hypothetical protein
MENFIEATMLHPEVLKPKNPRLGNLYFDCHYIGDMVWSLLLMFEPECLGIPETMRGRQRTNPISQEEGVVVYLSMQILDHIVAILLFQVFLLHH